MHDYHLLHNSLMTGAVLFALGVVGFVSRRSMAVTVFSTAVMAQGIVLTLCAFGRFYENQEGQVFSLFVMALSLVEAAAALGLAAHCTRRKRPHGSPSPSTGGEESGEPPTEGSAVNGGRAEAAGPLAGGQSHE